MTYKKVGGIRFVRIGRFGFSFYITRKRMPLFAAPLIDPIKIIDDGIRVIVAGLSRNVRSADAHRAK